ncbi:MAG TPA: [protein-PII] uridylyltransferase [Actinomycetota bacterium]|nr:[protein-PII] uridylyltransferase [Actinomycetota bacterium]
MLGDRNALLEDEFLTGAAWCRAHSDLVDAWLTDLLTEAGAGHAEGLGLAAVGGYGRSELAPGSDIDVMLLHEGRPDLPAVAERLWYPIWEKGLRLGHSVCTVREGLRLASDDLESATTLLSARHVAGDGALTARLAAGALASWERRSRHWLPELAARVAARHERVGEVAFRLEPDLKEGRGGLRDVHSLRWAEAAHRVLLEFDAASLDAWSAVLLDARVELQRQSGHPSNVLALQEQPAVARALGDSGPEALMARIAEAARSIAWTSDDAWRRIDSALRSPLARRAEPACMLGPGIVLRGGEVGLAGGAAAGDALLPLRVAAAAATHGAAIERRSLERLAAGTPALGEPWPSEARLLLVALLLAGDRAIAVIEALDQRGLWGRLLPEWRSVRALPPHNAYHRFTVDRHLLETVARSAILAERVDRPDLLVVAALLHDLGKGSEGDHSEAGARLARSIGARMGFPPADVETLERLVGLHLLLPQVATRRDLDDAATARRVAAEVGTLDRLRLLAALTEADSRATGPSAWGPWKADLVGLLVDRVAGVLDGADPAGAPPGGGETFPTRAQLDRLAAGGRHIEGHGHTLTVMNEDRPGMFSRVAGVLALHGLDVLAAAAWSSDDGRALAEFRIADPLRGEPPWSRVVADLKLALDGRLAIQARVGDRARTYARAGPASRVPVVPAVAFDNQASEGATVIDVRAPDAIGTLYRITRTLADFDLDIRSAKVQTLGSEVVDAFYVCDRDGRKVTDAARLAEIERAILHSLGEEPGSRSP